MLDTKIITPRLTEKAYMLATQGIYTFVVPLDFNRNQIADMVEAMYGVKVVSVKIVKQNGKAKKLIRNKRSYPSTRYDQDFKKAYVKLAKGDSIAVFDQGEEDEQAKEAK